MPIEPAKLKLSEASKVCGISVDTLQLLIADELVPQAVRSPQRHAYLPEDAVPTWQQCRQLVEQHRDRQLQRAAKLLDRLAVELEAVRTDVAEAREHPSEPLGVDLLAATSYSAHGHSTTTLSAALQQLDLVRMQIVRSHSII